MGYKINACNSANSSVNHAINLDHSLGHSLDVRGILSQEISHERLKTVNRGVASNEDKNSSLILLEGLILLVAPFMFLLMTNSLVSFDDSSLSRYCHISNLLK